jgi:hypothetical protein
MHHSQQKPSCLLCSAYLYYMCTFFFLHARFLCMLFTMSRFFSSGCSLPLHLSALCSLKNLSPFLHSTSSSHVESYGDHHGNSSYFLVVTPMHSSSLGIMLSFLSFTGSPNSSSSLTSVNHLYD